MRRMRFRWQFYLMMVNIINLITLFRLIILPLNVWTFKIINLNIFLPREAVLDLWQCSWEIEIYWCLAMLTWNRPSTEFSILWFSILWFGRIQVHLCHNRQCKFSIAFYLEAGCHPHWVLRVERHTSICKFNYPVFAMLWRLITKFWT